MSCEAFPRGGASAAAGSCSDGGASEPPAFYSKLRTRLLSAWAWPSSVLFHRPPDVPSPLGSLLPKMGGGGLGAQETKGTGPAGSLLPAIGQWLGVSHYWIPEADGGEEAALPLRDCQPSAPWSQSLLGKVWGKVWLGALEPHGWYGLARRAACYPQGLNMQTSDQWPCHHPASSRYHEKLGFSIWAHSDLPFSAVQRMEKPAELSQPDTIDQDHGYFSLEIDHTFHKEQQLNAGNVVSPPSECAMDHCSEADDMKEKKDNSVENEEAVLLHLVDVDLTTRHLLEIENKIISSGGDEWGSSDDESEDDSEEEEINLSISRPQCSNKTIAYILGSPGSNDDDSEDQESDWDSDGFDSDESSELSDSNVDLWNPFAEFSDPYNPLNFRASINTRHKLETRTVFEPSNPQQPVSCFPVIEDLEDRLDSGFSEVIQDEPLTPHVELPLRRKCSKRVAFDEHVTEYYVSSEEIRKGPWEEYARDRCRFQKRIKETEECIGYCFTLKHRWTVLQRMQLGS
ncbi:protein phosphatase 1 regulatory subunit 15B [Pristis pectinata]|uniref:protein phosphatase 1 regulatory subunit 15B n=1 Tax=Pristis pectinata TaxID=685728 RepID=UPI00223E0498|nr:protein phosphatase 1 regulatory subunit 15B [Pristis pectinata]